jgi:predicted ATP-dependent serine protease
MKVKITTFSEMQKGNIRNCWSAKRTLGRCFDCHLYDKCESKITNAEYDKLQKQMAEERAKHEKAITDLKNKIGEIDR